MRSTADEVKYRLPRRAVVASLATYCAVTALAGRQVLASLSTAIVHDPGDPLLTAAILHWNAWTLPLTHAWWQFPIFAPTPDALAFSEHLLGLSVVATPIEWLVRNPLVAANLVTLLTYPLCGLAMFLLVHRLTRSVAAAFLAGVAFAFSPYRAAQVAHVQMLAAFWAPLALLALHAYLETGRRSWLVMYGAAWLLQALANGYSLFFFSGLIALWTGWFVIVPRRWVALRDITVATVCAAVPLAPTLGTYVAVHARHGFVRSFSDVKGFSADVSGLLCASKELSAWGWLEIGCRPEGALFPGLVLAGLVVIASVTLMRTGRTVASRPILRAIRAVLWIAAGLAVASMLAVAVLGSWRFDVAGVRASASGLDKPLLMLMVVALLLLLLSRGALLAARRQSVPGFYLFGALVMWMLSLGPIVIFNGIERALPGPFGLLLALPGGDGIRVPARFWLMTTLCLAVVAGLTAGALLERRRPRAAAWLTAVLALGLLSDGWVPIGAVPAPERYPDEALLRGRTVLALPVGNFQDFAPQYLAVVSGWRSVNGYSGYEPSYYEAVVQGSRFEVNGLFTPFRAREDLFVVVGRGQTRLRDLVERQPGVVRVAERDGVLEYRLPRGAPPETDDSRMTRLPIASAMSTCLSDATPLAFDGDLDTRWMCGPQSGHETFVVDLGHPVDDVALVRYALGRYFKDFPRELIIDTSVDGETWEPGRAGDVVEATIEGAMAEPLRVPATLRFAPRRARYVRLRQVGHDDAVDWSLAELEIRAAPLGESAKGY